MCFFISFMPATFLAVIGYFVLFSSTWAVNGIRTFGRILAIWIFVIAALIPIAGAYVALTGLCPDLKTLHSTMMRSPTP
jgi:TRAP-type mannitol/chloroaromatic compound transport system permease small subunit